MDITVLDLDFKGIGIIDIYTSLIWTDRYDTCGEFQLELIPTPEVKRIIKLDYYLEIAKSEHTMIIETIEINDSSESGAVMIVTGRSLESILERRVAANGEFWGMENIVTAIYNTVLSNFCGIPMTNANEEAYDAVKEAVKYEGDIPLMFKASGRYGDGGELADELKLKLPLYCTDEELQNPVYTTAELGHGYAVSTPVIFGYVSGRSSNHWIGYAIADTSIVSLEESFLNWYYRRVPNFEVYPIQSYPIWLQMLSNYGEDGNGAFKIMITDGVCQDSVKNIVEGYCKLARLGYQIIRSGCTLIFKLTHMCNKTVDNTDGNPPIIFSREFGNMVSSRFSQTTVGTADISVYKHKDNDWSGKAIHLRTISEGTSNPSGILRREQCIESTCSNESISQGTKMTPTDARRYYLSDRRVNKQYPTAFDCELDPNGQFSVANSKIRVGDIVTVCDYFGTKYSAIVTEIVYSCDEQGETACPTFLIDDVDQIREKFFVTCPLMKSDPASYNARAENMWIIGVHGKCGTLTSTGGTMFPVKTEG